MSTEIYLLRHGQASFGARNYDALSDTGHRQADKLAGHLLERDILLDRVISGDLSRQRDTAAAYVRAATHRGHRPRVMEHAGFNEFQAEKVVRHYLPRVTLGQPELADLMKEPDAFRRHFQPLFVAVIRSWLANEHPHDRVESWVDFRARVRSAMAEILGAVQDGEKLGVFTSGGVISVILQQALGTGDDIMYRLNHRIANASVTRLSFDGDLLHLAWFNHYQHLEDEDILTFR